MKYAILGWLQRVLLVARTWHGYEWAGLASMPGLSRLQLQ